MTGADCRPMDDTYEKAQLRLADILEQKQGLEREETELRSFLALHGTVSKRLASINVIDRAYASVLEGVMAKRSVSQQVIDAAIEAMKDGFPMHTRELLAIIEERKIPLGGKDKLQALSKLLGMSGLFTSSRKDGWTLKRASPDTVAAVGALD